MPGKVNVRALSKAKAKRGRRLGAAMRKSRWPVALVLLVVPLAGCTAPSDPAQGPITTVDRATDGLAPARTTEEVRLANASTFDLTAGLVSFDPGTGARIRMFAYNGQVPGPTLRVQQGSAVSVRFTNALPYDTTMHWHGLRLDVAMDGVPGMTQAVVAPGATFRYELKFPDEGVYWYHPHVREDLQQELGLAGLIVVDGPRSPAEVWPREQTLVLDDLLLEAGDVAPFQEEEANRALMGRFGNTLLVNGAKDPVFAAAPGERLRLLVLDASNARTYQFAFPGAARVDWIGVDGGFFETPRNRSAFTLFQISPGERLTIDVVMPEAGNVTLQLKTPERTAGLARWAVQGAAVTTSTPPMGPHARAAADLLRVSEAARKPPEVTWDLDVDLAAAPGAGSPHAGMQMGRTPARAPQPVEWEEVDGAANAQSTPADVRWILRDNATGAENAALNHTFALGSLVNIRIRNLADSEHPMQHPIHLHGQRFVVASRDGIPNPDRAWKDTVLVPGGKEVMLTVEMANPGTWMVHCHISEHLEAGMAGSFTVA